jgi:peptide/nickel transport system substrate-binding protein
LRLQRPAVEGGGSPFFRKRTAFLLSTLLLNPLQALAAPGDCGTVIIPTDSDITTLNPMLSQNDADTQAAQLMYMGLIWINRFQQIDWSRSLASAITTLDTGKVYQVTLRPHWSDGVAITSADIAYDLRLMRQLYQSAGNGGMPGIIKSLIVRDPTHFDIVLSHRVNPRWFITNGLAQLLPLPARDLARYSIDQLQQMQSTPGFFKIVDGPLKISRMDVGQDLVLVPNPDYPGPAPHFRQLIFRFIESDNSALQMIEASELDIAPLPLALWNAMHNILGVQIEFLDPRAIYYHMFLNFNNPEVTFFHDVEVRPAMQDAIDQQAMINLLFHGHGMKTLAPLDPSQAAFLAPALQAGHYPVGYDPVRAETLLRADGYAAGPDGIMVKNGKRLSFTSLIPSGSTQSLLMAEMVKAQLRAMGIEMNLRQLDINQLVAEVYGGAPGWQTAYLYTIGGGYPTGELDFATGGALNAGGYSDPEMNQLIQASIDEEGMDHLYTYEVYASAQVPVIFGIAPPNVVFLVRNRLHGVNQFYDPAGQLAPEQLTCADEN